MRDPGRVIPRSIITSVIVVVGIYFLMNLGIIGSISWREFVPASDDNPVSNFVASILMERIYGYSETSAGLLSTARPLMFSLSAPIAGYAAVKVGERWSVVAGAGAV